MAPAFADIPFNFQFPVEVWRKSSSDPDREWRIGGIISTEHKDRQGEVVIQRGLDFNDFLKAGWLNDNHSRETVEILGYPLRVHATTWLGKPATYMEGYLLKDYPPAQKLMQLAESLQKTHRRLGFSVEGKIQRREGPDGKVIAKAKVTNVAITNCPVNTATGLEVLAKSMLDIEHESPCFALDECCGKCDHDHERELSKMLAAGAAIGAPPVAPGEGFPLRAESLEGVPHRDQSKPGKKKKRKKRLDKSEAMQIIRARFPLLSEAGAESVWQFAKSNEQQRRV